MLYRNHYTFAFCAWAVIVALFSAKPCSASETSPVLKSDEAWQAVVKRRLKEAVAGSRFSESELGVWVSSGSRQNHDVLFAINADKPMVPASLTKILTAAAVLQNFPLGHQFVTQLLTAGEIQNGVLKGDLILKGGGDSGFISESMWFLVNEFMRSEIREVTGDLIVDDTLFDRQHFDEGRDPERVDRAYDAPVGAMSFNWNSVNVYVRPGPRAGAPVKVFADPESEYIQVRSSAKTVSGRANSIGVSRRDGADGRELIDVTGSLGSEIREVVVYKSITRPALWAGYHLKAFLAQRGIRLRGQIRVGRAPETAVARAEAKSQQIVKAVADMMKFSNNYVAEMLTKSLAVEFRGGAGTMPAGMDVLRAYLGKAGIKDYVLTNPSGLSRKNQIKPQDLAKILIAVERDFRIFPEFLAALPIAGVDGTLKSRMKDGPGAQWVRAKTGLLTGVVGLAGYAGRSDGNIVTFVFLFNGKPAKMDEARPFFDRLATLLVSAGSVEEK